MANRSLSNRLHPRGFSYAEILLSVVLLTALLVPALQALQSGVAGGQSPSLAARQLALRDKMEQVLAKPFADLYAQTYPPAGSNPNLAATLADGSLSDLAGAPNLDGLPPVYPVVLGRAEAIKDVAVAARFAGDVWKGEDPPRGIGFGAD